MERTPSELSSLIEKYFFRGAKVIDLLEFSDEVEESWQSNEQSPLYQYSVTLEVALYDYYRAVEHLWDTLKDLKDKIDSAG